MLGEVVMHESIAKAQTKGTFRVANQKLDALNHDAVSKTKAKPSKKSITHFVDKIRYVYGDLLLRHVRKNKTSSWHFESEIVAFDPDPVNETDIGILHELVIEQVSSRNVLKGKSGYRYFKSIFFVHEHCVQRLLQRTNSHDKAEFSKLFISAAFSLAEDIEAFKTDVDTCHILYKDTVLIVCYVAALHKLIFKTVLLKSRFTERQTRFYGDAYLALDGEAADSFVCFYPESNSLRVVSIEDGSSAVEMALQFPEQFTELNLHALR
jgi:hypothetical protein